MGIIKKTPFLPNGNCPISEMVVAQVMWTVNDAWIFRYNANELCLFMCVPHISSMHQETARLTVQPVSLGKAIFTW